MDRFIAIVNPAAGSGKAAKLAGPKLAELRAQGLSIDVIASSAPGHAAQLAREAYAQGYRNFLAVGGDGTAHEILNGIFSEGPPQRRVSLGFLPFGTGNSFLRDFSKDGAAASVAALREGRKRPIDLLRLTHAQGQIYSFNLVSVGFAADVAAFTNRHLKFLGHLGYLVGVFVKLAQLQRRAFPLRSDGETAWDDRRCLFLTLNNSKYTGGTMLIAPAADTADGLIEFVRWGPVTRRQLVWNLRRLYDGTVTQHPLAVRKAVRQVEFNVGQAVDVTIDGEVFTVEMRLLEILPSAVDIYI
jgi:YegS/Rv2252/BmrU family lipid kinase